ncbi:nucleotidyltransferase family protein [Mesorhizobium tianshanense]|uniref:hypothetical protein n=1 Tax=Mesorhizobium tianshanense TaxID=39844 RepID=UPI0011A0F923|nr:hypothetical protein [Mesorhizobium tianshanense]
MQQFWANFGIAVEVTDFIELNCDQGREKVNSDQRFTALKEAQRKAKNFRGSLVWHTVNSIDHLMRSYYDSTGARRQKVEGRRSPATEAQKADWEVARASALGHDIDPSPAFPFHRLGRARWFAAERNGADLPTDERLSAGAVAKVAAGRRGAS